MADDALPARRQRGEHRRRTTSGLPSRRAGRGGDVVAGQRQLPVRAAWRCRARSARSILQTLTASTCRPSSTTGSPHGEVAGVRATISRTGYTGEDGFEIFVPPAAGRARVARAARRPGAASNSSPCGLGARDTLRLEACMRLCGSDMDETTTRARGGPRLDRRLEEGPTSSAPTPARRRRPAASRGSWSAFEMQRPRHRAARPPGRARRRASRRRHQRHADAVPEEGHRHGDGARRARRASARAFDDRHPRPRRPRPSGARAVLQAPERQPDRTDPFRSRRCIRPT